MPPNPLSSRILIGTALLGVVALAVFGIVHSSYDSASVPASFVSAPHSAHLHRIDVHTHLSLGALPQLFSLMDRFDFAHVVDLSGSSPDGRLAGHLAQAVASNGRVSVFMTFPVHELLSPGFGDRIASQLARAKDMGVKGFKIPKGLGLGYEDPGGNLLAVDDARLDPVFDACARLDLPVAIHVADPKAFWLPADQNNERSEELAVHPGWSFYGQPVPSWSELLDALERRIARHPHTTFISVHFGNAAEDPDRVARMLRAYPNLFIDTAARIPEFGRHSPEKMRAFFVEFQDRILYGTDLGVGVEPFDLMLGSSGPDLPSATDVARFFTSSYRYFETADRNFESPTPIQGRWTISGIDLPPSVLRKIYGDNARRLLHLVSASAP